MEAAQAVGLAPWKTMRLIVLPQALRATIPAMVGQFISLFKDTTLVAILGVTELLERDVRRQLPARLPRQGLFVLTLELRRPGLLGWLLHPMSSGSRGGWRAIAGVGER